LRFDRSAEAAPEIQFPVEVESVVPLIEESRTKTATASGAGPRERRFLASRKPRVATRKILNLWEELTARDAQLSSRLQNAVASFAEREVLVIGRTNQRIKRRVFEDLPPLANVLAI